MSMRHRFAFTLIEMMVASVLAALLMGGVLLMVTAIGRDRARIARDEVASAGSKSRLVDQFRRDLTSATTMTPIGGRALILEGHGGLDPQTLAPTGRLTRVIYEVRGKGKTAALFRSQAYLDEPTRPEAWTELVAMNVNAFAVLAETPDGEAVRREKSLTSEDAEADAAAGSAGVPRRRQARQAYYLPSRVRLRVQIGAGFVDEELWLR
jgi:prepilin-type N-terminal cleavage/methylation domain-containing protein